MALLFKHAQDQDFDQIDPRQLDRNQDGYICVKHLSPELHLHIDNDIPLE